MAFLLTIQMYIRSPFSANSNEIEGVLPQVGLVNDFNFSDKDDMMQGDLDFQL